MRNHPRGKARRAAAGKAAPLAYPAKINHGLDGKALDQRQVGIARLGVLARAQQHPAHHPAPARYRIAAIIAQVVNALGDIEGADAGGIGGGLEAVANHGPTLAAAHDRGKAASPQA